MTTFYIIAGVVLLLLMVPAVVRIVKGPTAIDRTVGVNVIGTKTAVLLVIIGMIFKRVDMFVDFALAYGLLNFIGSIAAARYLHRSKEAPVDDRKRNVKESIHGASGEEARG
ncbi:MAG: monovalent cation/H+ antiporter complex subunit F [Verrucomicrobiales bacterium]|nr:pH regulation protein F [Verrucomicrobiae bacterium]HRX54322.1 monovalent cation/H+ antiporter complex subunit F [Verrucomicrobiales bacterium]